MKLQDMSDVCVVGFDVLSLADFQTWSDDALRCYLSLWAKSVEGNLSELAACAFVCSIEKVAVNESQEHRMRVNLASCKKKLTRKELNA